jgi:hypothetical protein
MNPTKNAFYLVSALLAGFPVAMYVSAAEPTRIYYLGNSLTDELKYDAFVQVAEAGGEKIVWGRHMIPGVPIRGLWGADSGFMQNPFGHWKKALREFEWDVVTLQPFSPFEGEYQHAILFAKEITKKSPAVQLYIYAQWPGKGRGPDWFEAFAGPSETPGYLRNAPPEFRFADVVAGFGADDAQRLQGRSLRDEYEAVVLGLRQRGVPAKPVRMIPVGHVMQLLGQKMRAGLVPGYRTPWDFYSDGVHVNNDGSYLVACTFYATIFGKSPVGLPIGPYQGQPGLAADGIRISPELARTIQETVWEVVSAHPLTGVTASEPLRVASPLLFPAVAGEPYRFDLLPAFGQAPYKWSVAQGTLPAGLTLSAQGVLSGTAAAESQAELTLQVADAKGSMARKDLTLVVEQDVPPVLPHQALPELMVGQFVQHQMRSEAGNGIHRWSVQEGNTLPAGLSLEPDGRLWGSPGKVGPVEFGLVVEDGDGANPERDERTFAVTVGPARGEVALARRLTLDANERPPVEKSFWQFRYPIKKLVQGERVTVSGAFDVAWTDEHLYVAVKVDDPTVNQGGWASQLQADNVILCLDAFNNREATYNADDRYLPYSRGHQYAQRSIMIGTHLGHGCRQLEIPGGYLAVFEVSWRGLGLGGRVAPYRVIGLDVMLVDDTQQGVPKSTVVWQGTKDNATDPSHFGTVILSAAQ